MQFNYMVILYIFVSHHWHNNKFLRKENVKVFEIFEKNDILKRLIKYLKEEHSIKYTDIMKKFDITKGVMERLK